MEEINQIFGRRNFPAIIGRKSFVDKIKGRFFTDKTHEEVPESSFLAPDADTIINEVCKYYNVARINSFYLNEATLMSQGRLLFIL